VKLAIDRQKIFTDPLVSCDVYGCRGKADSAFVWLEHSLKGRDCGDACVVVAAHRPGAGFTLSG
jgi:hypothetical protein